jgi:hypothetical protein
MEEYKPSLVKAATQRPPSGKGRAPAATGVAAGRRGCAAAAPQLTARSLALL